jgi:hypothetical protein
VDAGRGSIPRLASSHPTLRTTDSMVHRGRQIADQRAHRHNAGSLLRAQPLDELYLTWVVDRMAGDSQHQIEPLGLAERRGVLAGLEVGDQATQLLMFHVKSRPNAGPRQRLLVLDREPVLTVGGPSARSTSRISSRLLSVSTQ